MAGKRKREITPLSPAKSPAATAPTPGPSTDSGNRDNKRRKADDVMVVWQLADGSRRFQRKLGKDKTLNDAIYKMVKKLDISTPGNIRLAQIREGGREVEILDDFDYRALKERATAKAEGGEVVVKVYPGSRFAEPLPSILTTPIHSTMISTSAPSSAHVTPSPAPSGPVTSSTPSAPAIASANAKGKKRAPFVNPSESPFAHTGSPNDTSSSTLKAQLKKGAKTAASIASKKARTSLSSDAGVSTPTAKPATPASSQSKEKEMKGKKDTISVAPMILPPIVETDSPSSSSAPPSTTPTQHNQQTPASTKSLSKSKTKRDAKQQAAQKAQANPSASTTTSFPAAPVSPMQSTSAVPIPDSVTKFLQKYKPVKPSPLGSAQPQNPREASPAPVGNSAPPGVEKPPNPGSKRQKKKQKQEQKGRPRLSAENVVGNELPVNAEASSSKSPAVTPAKKASARKTPKKISQDASALAQAVTGETESADQSRSEPAPLPATESAAKPVGESGTLDIPVTPPKVVSKPRPSLSLASVWNLFDKPAEPPQTPDYSSSSFISPKKSAKKTKVQASDEQANVDSNGTNAYEDNVEQQLVMMEQPSSQPEEAGQRAEDVTPTKKGKGKGKQGVLSKKKAPAQERAKTNTLPVAEPETVAHRRDKEKANDAVEETKSTSMSVETDPLSASPEDVQTPEMQSTVVAQHSSSTSSVSDAILSPGTVTPSSSETTAVKHNVVSAAPSTPAEKKAKPNAPKSTKKANPNRPVSTYAKDIMASYRAKMAAEEAEARGEIVEVPEPNQGPIMASGDIVMAKPGTPTGGIAPTEDMTANKDDAPQSQSQVDPILEPPSAQVGASAEEEEEPIRAESNSTSSSEEAMPVNEPSPAVEATDSASPSSALSPSAVPAPTSGPSSTPIDATELDLPDAETSKRTNGATNAELPDDEPWDHPLGLEQHGMTKGGEAQNAILASRAACIICWKTPTHLQKDCTVVKAGLEALETRKEDLTAVAAKKRKRRMEAEMARDGLEAIENWVKRLSALRKKVEGNKEASATVFVPEAAAASTLAKKTQRPAKPVTPPPIQDTPVEVSDDSVNIPMELVPETDPTPAPPTSVPVISPRTPGSPDSADSVDSPAPASSQPRPPINSQGTNPQANADQEEGVSMLDLLHKKALLAQARNPSKAGSLSGLSASDAVIETGSSDSESGSGFMSDSGPSVSSGSDSDSDSGSDNEQSGSEQDDEDVNMERSTKPSSSGPQVKVNGNNNTFARNAEMHSSSSDSDSDAATRTTRTSRRSSSSSSTSSINDPESSFLHYLSKPLSAKQKRQARISAANMAPSQTLEALDSDVEMEDNNNGDDEDEEDNEPTPTRRGRTARAGSESSIDMGEEDGLPGGENGSVKSFGSQGSVGSEILPSSLTQGWAAPEVASDDIQTFGTAAEQEANEGVAGSPTEPLAVDEDTEMAEEAPEPKQQDEQEEAQGQTTKLATPPMTKGFAEIDRMASTSPAIDSFEGAMALQEAIDEEAIPGDRSKSSASLNTPSQEKRTGHVISKGLPSPPSSQDEEAVATQLRVDANDSTPKPRGRGRPPKNTASQATPVAGKDATTVNGTPMAASQKSVISQKPDIPESSQPSQGSLGLRRSTRSQQSAPTSPVLPTRSLPVETASPALRRSMRSASREIEAPSPMPSRRTRASQEPTSPQASQRILPGGRTLSATRTRSQITPDKVAEASQTQSSQLEVIEEQATPTKLTDAPRSSQMDEIESSQAIPNETTPEPEVESSAASTVRRSGRLQESPLFMTQPTQAMATQRYSTNLDSSQSIDTPRKSNGTVLRATSPIAEEDEASPAVSVDVETNGAGSGSESDRSSTSGDEDDGLPIIKPISIRRTASQGPPAVVMPTLSGLDKSILRNDRTRAKVMSASQPVAKSKKMVPLADGSESEESDSDSSEDEVPASRKGRYATGRVVRQRKVKTGGVPRGW